MPYQPYNVKQHVFINLTKGTLLQLIFALKTPKTDAHQQLFKAAHYP